MIIGVLTLLGYFLYNNLYQTIAQSKEIILLKQEVAPDTIDLKKVNEALAAIEAKTSKKNIFEGKSSKKLFKISKKLNHSKNNLLTLFFNHFKN